MSEKPHRLELVLLFSKTAEIDKEQRNDQSF